MSIDALQAKMKKMSNMLMVELSALPDQVPPEFLESNADAASACLAYCRELLSALKGEVPAVRFKLVTFSLLADNGMAILKELMQYAVSLGYYVLLDIPGLPSAETAAFAAEKVWDPEGQLPCDGILISGYYGSDVIKPFMSYVEAQKKDLFVIARSAAKSSAKIQDLLSGSRTVHLVTADLVNRFGASTVGKYGFSRVGIAVSATSGDSIRMLRTKYPRLFMLVDGVEVTGANAKNCAYGVNQLGHGAIVSVGTSVTGAWKEKTEDAGDSIQCAVDEVRKMQKKLDRYTVIL